MHWYLVPLDRIGSMRGPRHLKWRGNPAGLNVQWSLMDFGSFDVAVVAAATNEAQHADLAARADCFAVGDELTDEAITILQAYGIDTATLAGALPEQQQHRLLALALTYQGLPAEQAQPQAAMRAAAPVDVGALAREWAGEPIHFGIAGTVTDGIAGD